MSDSVLRSKALDFSVLILDLVKELKQKGETIIANQIGRSGTSIGANLFEAQYAQGKADFISKLQISLKEAAETGYWLELRYNDNSDNLRNMNEVRVVSLNENVSQIGFIDSFLCATEIYRKGTPAEYDGLPSLYGNENSGNCNSIQSMLEQIAGGTTPHVPDKAYGWSHVMSMLFFE